MYITVFKGNPLIGLPQIRPDITHAWHLFVILCEGVDRNKLYQKLVARQIGANVHYYPVFRHEYYQSYLHYQEKCPKAHSIGEKILTLPLFPFMTNDEVNYVIESVRSSLKELEASA